MADALLFVTDASQELTRSELDFLRQAREMCRHGAVRPHQDRLLSGLAGDPRPQPRAPAPGAGVTGGAGLPHLCGPDAVAANDAALNQRVRLPRAGQVHRPSGWATAPRTGWPARRRRGHRGLRPDWRRSSRRSGRRWRTRRRRSGWSTSSPASRQRVEALRTAAARVEQTLNDGIADLTSDIDHDLRDRIRRVIEEADAAIEETDPADSWSRDASRGWSRAVSHELLANYTMLRDRATALSEEVGRTLPRSLRRGASSGSTSVTPCGSSPPRPLAWSTRSIWRR